MKYKFYIILTVMLACLFLNEKNASAASMDINTILTTETKDFDLSAAFKTITDNHNSVPSGTGAEEVSTESDSKTFTADITIKASQKYKLKNLLKRNHMKLKDYSFKSDHPKTAAVSKKGIVTGINKGTARITITSKSNLSVCGIIQVSVKNRYTESDLRLMSSIIYSEAGCECYAGKKAVGIVVMNRIKSNQFPDSLEGVIYQRKQFTPTVNGSLNRSLSLYDSGKMSKSCIKAAKAVLNGDTMIQYHNKKYNLKGYLFFSRYVYNRKLIIQHHQFK